MKKNVLRIISLLLVFILFMSNAFATNKGTRKGYSAKTIGTVPEKYQKMVEENWAIAKGDLSEDGYYRIDTEKRKVCVNKYDIYGEKIYQTDYHYRYAGRDNIMGLFNYRFNINILRHISNDGSSYITSHTFRSLILLNINLSSKSVLTKISPDGEILWKCNLERKYGDMYAAVTEAPDGNVIVSCATYRKFFGDMDISESTSSLILLDSNGEEIHSKKFDDGIMFFYNIVCVDDKGFFAVGKDFDDKAGETKNYLCALDYDFNILWSYEIGDVINDWNCCDVLKSGYPVYAKTDESPYRSHETTIVYLDFNKNIVSQNTFKTENDKEFITKIHFLDNGEYIVEYEFDYQKDVFNEPFRCERFSADFQKFSEVELIGYGLHNIIETENERIFCCWNALTYTDNGNVDERECVYTAFDKDWNLLWQKGSAEKGTVVD